MPPCFLTLTFFPPSDDNPQTKDLAILPAYSTVDLVNEAPDENNPWDIPELKDTGIKWSGEAA